MHEILIEEFTPGDLSEGQAQQERNALVSCTPVQVPCDRCPQGFELTSNGVSKFLPAKTDESEKSKKTQYVTLNAVWVEADCTDLNGENPSKDVAFIRNGRTVLLNVSTSRFHERDGSLFYEMASAGIQIYVGSERDFLRYLQLFKPERTRKILYTTGWTDDALFALPDGSIFGSIAEQTDLRLDDHLTDPKLGAATSGTLEEWQDNVGKLCQGNSRLLFGVSAAFAAPMLKLLSIEGGGFNLRGPSSTGKTTAAKVAASVFGSPAFLKSMKSTANAFEATAAKHNDLPLIVDELAQAPIKDASDIVYLLANGKGKARATKSGGSRSIAVWSTLFFMTAEKSIADYLRLAKQELPAGVSVRCIDIPADTGKFGIFENLHQLQPEITNQGDESTQDKTLGAKFSALLLSGCEKFYGTAGQSFIRQLCSADKVGLRCEFESFEGEFGNGLMDPDSDGQIIRVLKRIALIAFAGEKATEWNVTGWAKGEAKCAGRNVFLDWLRERGSKESQEKLNLLEKVFAYFQTYRESRFPPFKQELENSRHYQQIAGYYDLPNGHFLVFPESFKEITAGFDRTFAEKILVAEGIITATPKKSRPRDASGKQFRAYQIKDVFKVEEATSRTIEAPKTGSRYASF